MKILNLSICVVTKETRTKEFFDDDNNANAGHPIVVQYEVELEKPKTQVRYYVELEVGEEQFIVGSTYCDVNGYLLCAVDNRSAKPVQAWQTVAATPFTPITDRSQLVLLSSRVSESK